MTANANPHGQAPTLDEHLRDWLEHVRPRLRPSTWSSYAGVVERHLVPRLGETPVDELTAATVTQFFHALRREGSQDGGPLAVGTVKYTRTVLRSALEYARTRGHARLNAAAEASMPDEDDAGAGAGAASNSTTWTSEQLTSFLDYVQRHPISPLIEVAAGTGARRGELFALTWHDIDLEDAHVRIHRRLSVRSGEARFEPLSTGRPREVHLPCRTVEALLVQREAQAESRDAAADGWANDRNLVFTGPDGSHRHPDAVTTEFRHLAAAAPVPTIAFKDLRATHAAILIRAGTPLRVVAQRLGYRDTDTVLQVYAHVLPSLDHDAARLFDDLTSTAIETGNGHARR